MEITIQEVDRYRPIKLSLVAPFFPTEEKKVRQMKMLLDGSHLITIPKTIISI